MWGTNVRVNYWVSLWGLEYCHHHCRWWSLSSVSTSNGVLLVYNSRISSIRVYHTLERPYNETLTGSALYKTEHGTQSSGLLNAKDHYGNGIQVIVIQERSLETVIEVQRTPASSWCYHYRYSIPFIYEWCITDWKEGMEATECNEV